MESHGIDFGVVHIFHGRENRGSLWLRKYVLAMVSKLALRIFGPGSNARLLFTIIYNEHILNNFEFFSGNFTQWKLFPLH